MKQKAYKHYLLVVLFLIQTSNYADGVSLGLVLQSIKDDLGLVDAQLGVLTGIAFALFYSVMGIPIARWADRGNRVTILALSAALWSVMVALCGMAASFLQLLLIRVGVAVGEAGCTPPAHSLIPDYFARSERPRAVAMYMLAGPMSTFVGYSLAGWVNEFYGWRVTFMVLGLPGLLLAVLAWLTLREPRRGGTKAGLAKELAAGREAAEAGAALRASRSTVGQVCATLWANTTFRYLLLSFSVMFFFSTGMSQWQPAFFIRSFGLRTGAIGTWLALIYGLGGVFGTYAGGALAVRHAANNESLQLKGMSVVLGIFCVASAAEFLAPNEYAAFAAMSVGAVGGAAISGPLFATIQTLVPERMRAMAIALIYLFANLIGTGLGPLAVGGMSDALRPALGDESLRYALLMLCPGYLLGAWFLWRASRSVSKDLLVTSDIDHVPVGGSPRTALS
jgi:MFS family permease